MSKSSAVNGNGSLHTPIYGLFVLAILYTLYLAHEVILPIVLALLVTLLLSPVVEGLYKRFRLPKAISALMLLLLLITGVLGIGYSMSGPLMQWVERAPSTLTELLVGESKLQQRLDQLTSTATEIEEQIEAQLGDEVDTAQTVVLQTDSWRSQFTSGLYQTIAGVTLALALTYFLLVSGDRMLLNLASQLSRRKRAIMLRIVRNGQQQITRYLGVITATNSAIGIAIGLIAWAIGLPSPVVWAVIVALTRFIPYLGVILAFVLLTIVSASHFDSLLMIAITPVSFMLISSLVGFFLEPYIHGMRLAVNPVVIFIAIFFWGWLWGPIGVFIAVPLMTVIMVVISHIPQLNSLYWVLAKDPKPQQELHNE